MPPWQAKTSAAPTAQGLSQRLQGAETHETLRGDLEQDQGISNVAELDFTQLDMTLGSGYPASQQTPGLFPTYPQDDWTSPSRGSPLEYNSSFSGQELMFFDPTLMVDYPSQSPDNSQQRPSDELPTGNYDDLWLNNFSSNFSPGIQSQTNQAQQTQRAGSHPSSYTPPLMDNSHPGLPRRRSRYLRSPGQTPRPISIPHSSTGNGMDPMQRWQDSPPETEAASLSAIAGALKHAFPRPSSSESPRSRGPGSRGSRAASTTSFNSENTSRSSRSATSVHSSTSKDLLARPMSSRVGITKKKRGKNTAQPRRAFQCTFCCDSFKSKYDWSRHEKSLHLSLDGWVCTPHGGSVVSPDTGISHCVYCNSPEPTPEHLETHNHSLCQTNGPPHIFNRKDHLVQHLKLAHQLKSTPAIDNWKVEAPPMVSRCGICNTMLDTLKGRVDHLAQHYREGKTMDDWRGDHCFEPSIAARVTNALPPYLIGPESKSIVPFSATDSGTKDHLSQIRKSHDDWIAGQGEAEIDDEPSTSLPALMDNDPTSTFVNVLTLGLGRYARQQMKLGIIPTDEMFQNESRRLLYRTEDAFDQTIADNTEWLGAFKRQHMGGNPNGVPQ
ncbi:hypothetical protein BGZ61DRAFT_476510 [Ilyonectria robusta]|uniref:uncharacterized protein n=1 Tax=Ilyonectria robusta TaxID=1079257 RepID=UPI001E8DD0C8|nr:uncharacterized protein BGZ61DRAFT_476510 [Ilyonectria robusta]KAH8714431.1 hypothetical protein BGZ61DRAFT_476510 [Ilyonectria robusta]